MKAIRNQLIAGKHGKSIMADMCYIADNAPKPVVIFAHGFKGFKDWGHFPLVEEKFATTGFVFVKFNFSHNGTTPEHPADFADLEAFGNNNFSIELDDLGSIIDFILNESEPMQTGNADPEKIYLLGHSRGGGIVILKAAEDARVKKIATWAAVSDFGKQWSQNVIDAWKKNGVVLIENARTKQQMPLYYQLAENYFANQQRLHIPAAAKKLQIPFLIVHGTDDETVPFPAANKLHGLCPGSELLLLDDANHVFGGKHPYDAPTLPPDAEKAVNATLSFFKK